MYYFKKSIELNKNAPETYNNLGNLQNLLGSYEDAIETYKKAIKVNQKIYIKDLAKWISKKTRATILYSNEKTDSFTLNNNKLLNKLKMDKKLLNLKKNIIRII